MERLLTAKAVTDRLRIDMETFTYAQRSLDFPRKVFNDRGQPRWKEVEVEAWIRSRPRHEPLTRRRR